MQAVIDDQGRVEIPRSLREQLRLAPGALVDLEPSARGFQVTIVDENVELPPAQARLVREGTVLVLCASESVTVSDMNDAVDVVRKQRMDRIIGSENINPQ